MTRAGKRRKLVTVLVLLLLTAAGTALLWSRGAAKQTSYRAMPIVRGDLRSTILSTGVVAPENRLEIKPPIAGRVEQVLVEEGQSVRKGDLLAWMSSSERAALLDAARSRGPDELKRWEEFYKPTPLLAPIDGSIIVRKVEPGQSFTTQEAVLVMADRLTVKAQVDETDIAQIHLAQQAEIVLDAYPERQIPAKAVQIAFDATTVNNVTTYVVDVLPDVTPEFMRSGMTANVQFLVAAKSNVPLVPLEAVRNEEGAAHVLVPSAGTPVQRRIELGISDGKQAEVKRGLSEGEQVLIAERPPETARVTSPFSPFGGRRQQR